MGWFDFSRSPTGTAVETLRVPLFPLGTVLFPGGLLPLKIFEQRYLDMAAACLKAGSPFGICLRLRVRTADDDRPRAGALWLRFAVGTLSLLAGGLGFWWAWIDRDRLTWHDRASGTRVMREAPRSRD